MIRKIRKLFNPQSILALLFAFTMFNLPTYVLAQEATEPPVVVTDEAPAPEDGVIIVNSPGLGVDTSFLLTLAAIGAVGLIMLVRTRDPLKAGETVFDAVEGGLITDYLQDRFERMKPEDRLNLLKLIEVADPLADFTPWQLDDRAVAWLRSLLATHERANASSGETYATRAEVSKMGNDILVGFADTIRRKADSSEETPARYGDKPPYGG